MIAGSRCEISKLHDEAGRFEGGALDGEVLVGGAHAGVAVDRHGSGAFRSFLRVRLCARQC